jgi:hypothetical protein
MRPCPWCGNLPEPSGNQPKMIGCMKFGCPLRGILMQPCEWDYRVCDKIVCSDTEHSD